MKEPRSNLTQVSLGVAFIALLGLASLWILSPFLIALIWAAMTVLATWPMLIAVRARLGDSRIAAAVVMTLLMTVVFALPVALIVALVVAHSQDIGLWLGASTGFSIPRAPQWVANLPIVGERLATAWNEMASIGLGQFKPLLSRAAGWLALQLGTVGAALGHMFFTVVIAGILYAKGDVAAAGLRYFFRRLAGDRGERATVLAGQAMRGVALGVVVTAVAQTTVSSAGLFIAGVPFAGPLTLVTLLLCIAQLGPTLVLAPAVIWMYATDKPAWATVLLVFAVIAGTMDNILRPYLIKKGADLPLLLIFAGVIGGLLSIGVVGIFVGPVVLAVTYRLLEEWVIDTDAPNGLAAPLSAPKEPGGSDTTGVA